MLNKARNPKIRTIENQRVINTLNRNFNRIRCEKKLSFSCVIKNST